MLELQRRMSNLNVKATNFLLTDLQDSVGRSFYNGYAMPPWLQFLKVVNHARNMLSIKKKAANALNRIHENIHLTFS